VLHRSGARRGNLTMACKFSLRGLQPVAAFALLVATSPANGLQNGLGLTPQMVRTVRCLRR